VKCHRGLMFRVWSLSFGAARILDRRIAAKVFERPDFATSFGSYVVLGGQAGLWRASCAAGKETTVCSFFFQTSRSPGPALSHQVDKCHGVSFCHAYAQIYLV